MRDNQESGRRMQQAGDIYRDINIHKGKFRDINRGTAIPKYRETTRQRDIYRDRARDIERHTYIHTHTHTNIHTGGRQAARGAYIHKYIHA